MFFDRLKKQIPGPGEALPGRTAPEFAIPDQHVVLGTALQPPFPQGYEHAVFALGCFWGAERLFWQMPGVYTTAAVYVAGQTPHPTYKEVCTGRTGHAEGVLVVWDPAKISFEQLLARFFEEHDPTQGMRQGNDIGTQYRSGLYVTTDAQEQAAVSARAMYQEMLSKRGYPEITTEIERLGPVYYAEEYHQQYLHKVPHGYCGLKGTGVSCPIPRPVMAE